MKHVYIIGAVIIVAFGAFFFLMQNTATTDDRNTNDTGAYGDTTTAPTDSTMSNDTSTPTEAPDGAQTIVAVMSTSAGNITLSLDAQHAPKTVANFVQLAESGFYDGIKFHRVIPGFMVQAGDPLTKDDAMQARWGTGGPGYTFEDEIHAENRNAVGTISMANAGPNTNGSQFFINVADNNFLDTKHTVFGMVEEGLDVVMAISNVATEGPDRPVEAVVIQSVTIQ